MVWVPTPSVTTRDLFFVTREVTKTFSWEDFRDPTVVTGGRDE